jgi:hypothetical protein
MPHVVACGFVDHDYQNAAVRVPANSTSATAASEISCPVSGFRRRRAVDRNVGIVVDRDDRGSDAGSRATDNENIAGPNHGGDDRGRVVGGIAAGEDVRGGVV